MEQNYSAEIRQLPFCSGCGGSGKPSVQGPVPTSSPLASSSSPCPSSSHSRRLLKPPPPEPPHDHERHGPVNMALNWTSGNLFLSELPYLEITACLSQQHQRLWLGMAGKGASFIIHVCWGQTASTAPSLQHTLPVWSPLSMPKCGLGRAGWMFEGSSEHWVPGLQRPVVS